jgi:glycerol-3-phosphate dehydrogenase
MTDALAGAPTDMIVIGGGITGSGIARDAALRGLRVVLVEQNDFASGTSSRSSRLIHGGVRYLEHGYLHLVFEASAERRRLLRLAPHLVHPLQFTWPVYRGARVPLWKLSAGLALYDALALFRNVGRHKPMGASAMLAAQPGLRAEGLVGGATYFDAATDDTRLTLAVALDAARHGARLRTHTRVESFIIEGGRAMGVSIRDELSGQAGELRAPMIVNATGPWSDFVQQMEGGASRPHVQGSKGVHIAIPPGRVRHSGALTLLSPTDGRVMFILPSGKRTIIGTTDTFTSASPDRVRASAADVQYLIDAANYFFPQAALTRDDVISAWAGIRPLAASDTGDPVAASREHVVSVSPAGVVTITGGKLTTFRIMAEQTVDRALHAAGRKKIASRTANVPIESGRRRPRVNADSPIGDTGYAWEDFRFSCESEMARTLGDLLIRRTHLAFETKDHARSIAPRVAEYVAPVLGWSESDRARELRRYDDEVESIFGVEP